MMRGAGVIPNLLNGFMVSDEKSYFGHVSVAAQVIEELEQRSGLGRKFMSSVYR